MLQPHVERDTQHGHEGGGDELCPYTQRILIFKSCRDLGGERALHGGEGLDLCRRERRMPAHQPAAGHPLRIEIAQAGVVLLGSSGERRPRRLARRTSPDQAGKRPHPPEIAVEERLLLVREVVGEGPPGDTGLVSDGVDGDPVGAVLQSQPQRRLVQRLTGGRLLALAKARLGHRCHDLSVPGCD
jgi:hypothetical protein